MEVEKNNSVAKQSKTSEDMANPPKEVIRRISTKTKKSQMPSLSVEDANVDFASLNCKSDTNTYGVKLQDLLQAFTYTRKRLKVEPGFSSALDADRVTQREAEFRWLHDPCFDIGGVCYWNNLDMQTDPKYFATSELKFLHLLPQHIHNTKLWLVSSQTVPSATRNILMDINAMRIGCSEKTKYSVIQHHRMVQHSRHVLESTYETMIRHSGFIGSFGTNSLRLRIPTFPFIYGFAEQLDNPSNITLIAEDVMTGTRSLTDRLPELTSGQLYLIIMQVIYALQIAHGELQYTHYDLNLQSILLQSMALENGRCGPVYLVMDDVAIDVTDAGIVKILDSCVSHISVTNQDGRPSEFGACHSSTSYQDDMTSVGIYRDRSHPLSDVFQFIIHLASSKYERIASVGYAFLKYFISDQSIQATTIIETLETSRLPLDRISHKFTFSDFIDFAKKEAKNCRWSGISRGVVSCVTASKIPNASFILPGCGFITPFHEVSNHSTTMVGRLIAIPFPDSYLEFLDIYDSATKVFSSIDNNRGSDESNDYKEVARTISKTFIDNYMDGTSKFSKSKNYSDTIVYNLFADAKSAAILLAKEQIHEGRSSLTPKNPSASKIEKQLTYISVIITSAFLLERESRAILASILHYWTPEELPEDDSLKTIEHIKEALNSFMPLLKYSKTYSENILNSKIMVDTIMSIDQHFAN